MDISHFDVAREIGAVHKCVSDAKFNEEVFELINSAWRECEEELRHGAISGEAMIKELVEASMKVDN